MMCFIAIDVRHYSTTWQVYSNKHANGCLIRVAAEEQVLRTSERAVLWFALDLHVMCVVVVCRVRIYEKMIAA